MVQVLLDERIEENVENIARVRRSINVRLETRNQQENTGKIAADGGIMKYQNGLAHCIKKLTDRTRMGNKTHTFKKCIDLGRMCFWLLVGHVCF